MTPAAHDPLVIDSSALLELIVRTPRGRALEFLMEIRLDEGEISPQEAAVRLREWWSEQEK